MKIGDYMFSERCEFFQNYLEQIFEKYLTKQLVIKYGLNLNALTTKIPAHVYRH